MTDLQKFCADKNSARLALQNPFSRGEWTYATNGHIAVRVARLEEVLDNEKAPNVEKLFTAAENRTGYQWVDIPEVTVKTFECTCCDGGWIEYKSEKIACDECDGTGRETKSEPVRFNCDGTEIGLANIYLDLIKKELPSAQIGLIKEASVLWSAGLRKEPEPTPVKIKFDGGEGLLMAMRL